MLLCSVQWTGSSFPSEMRSSWSWRTLMMAARTLWTVSSTGLYVLLRIRGMFIDVSAHFILLCVTASIRLMFSGGRVTRALFLSTVCRHLAAETGNTSALMKAPSSSTPVPPPGSARSLNSRPTEWNPPRSSSQLWSFRIQQSLT